MWYACQGKWVKKLADTEKNVPDLAVAMVSSNLNPENLKGIAIAVGKDKKFPLSQPHRDSGNVVGCYTELLAGLGESTSKMYQVALRRRFPKHTNPKEALVPQS